MNEHDLYWSWDQARTNKRAPKQEKVGNTEPEDHSGSTHHHAD